MLDIQTFSNELVEEGVAQSDGAQAALEENVESENGGLQGDSEGPLTKPKDCIVKREEGPLSGDIEENNSKVESKWLPESPGERVDRLKKEIKEQEHIPGKAWASVCGGLHVAPVTFKWSCYKAWYKLFG